jgi:hypothetical protein
MFRAFSGFWEEEIADKRFLDVDDWKIMIQSSSV